MKIDLLKVWIALGSAMSLFGFYYYLRIIWHKNKNDFKNIGLLKNIGNIIAYVPKSDSKEMPHIVAGVSLTIGLSILLGYFISTLINKMDAPNLSFHGVFITTSCFIFGILISALSFWTLWQTKKIEQLQGYKIRSFLGLIKEMGEELERFLKRLQNDSKNLNSYHRFLFVTTNPFFGILSHEDEPATIKFRDLLITLKERLKGFKIQDTEFRFEIICGNTNKLEVFHTDFYTKKALKEKIPLKNKETEMFLTDFEKENILTRAAEIPKFPQFAIIGNTLFEFTLDAEYPHTEVSETYIVTDRARCDMYQKTFELLKSTLPK